MDQRDMDKTVGVRVKKRHPVPADGQYLRVPDLKDVPIGKPQLEGLERLSVQPLPDGLRVRGCAFQLLQDSTQLCAAPPFLSLFKCPRR